MRDSLDAGPRLSGLLPGTHRDKNAVRVLGLAGLVHTHEVGQALDVVDAHHVDVVVEAESLDEGEVDLEGDVTLVLLIGGEDAERHAVWVTEGKTGTAVRIQSVPSCRCVKCHDDIWQTFSRIAILTHS